MFFWASTGLAERWTTYTKADGIADNNIGALALDGKGNLWAATSEGASRFDGRRWTTVAGISAQSMAIDSSGNVWVGGSVGKSDVNILMDEMSEGGVAKYDGARWQVYTEKDGLSAGASPIWSIAIDAEGNVWAGAMGSVSRFDGEKWKVYTTDDGLSGGVVWAIYPDTDGSVWFGTSKGVSRFDGISWKTYQKTKSLVSEANTAAMTFTINIAQPTAAISYPTADMAVAGEEDIIGIATDEDFKWYKLEYGEGEAPNQWTQIGNYVISPVFDGLLMKWDTSRLNGVYTLKLTVMDKLAHANTAFVTVRVVAAKQRVNRQIGGVITDAEGKVRISIPPNALKEDAEITIRKMPDAEIKLPDEPVKYLGVAYELGPKDLSIEKPITIAFSYEDWFTFVNTVDVIKGQETALQTKSLAIFRWNEKRGWERVGGAVERNSQTISFSVSLLGVYALMEDRSKSAPGKTSISNVNCQPRVFSPKGSAYSTETVLSFNLTKSAKVTVKIYNMAGYLTRTLAEGKEMNRGINTIRWNGKDDDASFVISGLYLCLIDAEGARDKKTVAVLNK